MGNEKEFFEKVADVATDVADTIVRTTSDLYQKGKLQVELAKMQSDIREANKKLGAVCYALEKGYTQDDGRKAELIAELDTLNDKVNEIQAARAAEREEKEAERAANKEAKENEKTARETKKAASANGPIEIRYSSETCAACGEARVGTLQYCGYCGAKFE